MPLFIHHASVTVASGSNSAVQHQNARSSPQHNPTAWRTWKPPATWQALTTRSTVATRNFASTWTTQATWTSAISSPNTNTKQHYIACNIAKRLSSTLALTGPPPINIDFMNDTIGGSASNALFVAVHSMAILLKGYSSPESTRKSISS